MSSIITVWGTLAFPPGAQRAWRALTLDGGLEDSAELAEYAAYLADEHRAVTVEEALARAADAYQFARFVEEGDALHVRAALGDDDWSEWLAILGAMARAAAGLGAKGTLEIEDDGLFVGRLRLGREGASFRAAAPSEVAADTAGREAVLAIFDERAAAWERAQTAKRKAAAAKRAARAPARKTSKRGAR